MSNHLPVRRSSALSRFGADRRTGSALSTIQTGAFLERAENEAQLQLTLAKMSDIGAATRHAFAEGEDMVDDFRGRVGDDPLTAKVLAPILEDGARDLRRALRGLSGGF